MTGAGGRAVDTRTLDRALEAFRSVVGGGAVLTDPEQLREFRDPFWHAAWDDHDASAVVQPSSVEEIQAIVRLANEHRVPLWVSSQGRNNGYGGSSPRVRGSVTVNLRRMNRVLELDSELGYALVEPGVRWVDLYEEIERRGAPLMLSIADIGWGSVIGNTLEYGMTYLPYGVDGSMQCGMEVVLPSGELMRTGMGAMPGNSAWNLYKRGLGPTPDQLFMQSNFGIVTKMGVWLMPKPEAYLPFWVRVWRDDDLAPLLDTLRRLSLDDTMRMVPQVLNTLNMAAVRTKRSDWTDDPAPMPESLIERIARELEVGRWLMRAALYGDEAVVAHRFAKVKQAFGHINGAEVLGGTTHDLRRSPELEQPGDRIQAGIPDFRYHHIARWAGGEEGGHIGFSPVCPMRGGQALALRDLLRGLVHEAGLDYLAGLIPPNARSFIHVTMVMFNTEDEAQTRRAYAVARKLVAAAAQYGYGEYRAHLDFMDLAAEQYTFNDHAYRRFNETIKDALDPNGILMPGKEGIWPRHMREELG